MYINVLCNYCHVCPSRNDCLVCFKLLVICLLWCLWSFFLLIKTNFSSKIIAEAGLHLMHSVCWICVPQSHRRSHHIFIQCLFQVWIVLLNGTSYMGLLERNNILYWLVQKFPTVQTWIRNGSDWTRTGFGTWIYIYTCIFNIIKQRSSIPG